MADAAEGHVVEQLLCTGEVVHREVAERRNAHGRCAELDTAVEASLAVGAIGARMTGGGFGGAAIALVAHDRVQLVTDAVTAAFAASGFSAPHIFTVTPSEGARRDA